MIAGTSGAVIRSAAAALIVTGATYSLSGVISPAVDGAGATVNLGGTAVASTTGAVHTLRIMTTQLLQEASQIIPNPQLLINVVSKRVRQLGLGHRPMVEIGPRASLTDIALKEIIAGKLTFEEQNASTDGA